MAGCVKLTPNGCFWQQGVLRCPWDEYCWAPHWTSGWVLTGEVQKAEMGSGDLRACGSGQIKLTSVGGQGIQVMLLEHSKSQGSLTEVLEMDLYHGWDVDRGGETESREFLQAALSLHCLSCLWLLLVQVPFLPLPWSSPLSAVLSNISSESWC